MASPLLELLLAAAAAALSWALVGLYARVMTAWNRLEAPNERSMHRVPVPVGAGLGMVATVVLLWPLSQIGARAADAVLIAAFAALGAVSWIDDRRGLSPAVRLLAQAVAVSACLAWMPPEVRVLPALPLALERLLLGVAWLWFVNLFNFMDGIDGLAGSEAVAIAMGYLVLAAYLGVGGPLVHLALIVAAASVGYLVWNWHPARVFMGDAGSVPLGFVLGWLLIDLAVAGLWAAAAILPLYFAADATYTLLRRALRGEKPWQAHREHFYQRAVLGGATPAGVAWRVGAANAAFLALALVSTARPLAALAGAALVLALLLAELARLARGAAHAAR